MAADGADGMGGGTVRLTRTTHCTMEGITQHIMAPITVDITAIVHGAPVGGAVGNANSSSPG